MTASTNQRLRFMDNNLAELITGSITQSSEQSSFPFANAINPFRSKVWSPSGLFEVYDSNGEGPDIEGGSQNDQLYINDGAAKTVTLTAGDYDSPADLATHIQTQLNASSSGWAVTYDSSGGTYKFTITNSGSVTLVLSNRTNAIWDSIGFTQTADETGTSFTAAEQRNHTREYAQFDLGYAASVEFFAAISPLDELFSISKTATVRLLGSNITGNWATAPISITLNRTSNGFLRFLDDIADTNYRFWLFEVTDFLNPLGPEGISVGHIYLGDYFTLTTRNLRSGFTKNIVDPSDVLESEDGSLYFDRRTIYTEFGNMILPYLSKAEVQNMEDLYVDKGRSTPFYVTLDPQLTSIDELEELTKYVVFNDFSLTHQKSQFYTASFSLRELI